MLRPTLGPYFILHLIMAEWLKVSQISQRDTDVSRKEIGHRSFDDYATHK